jgi:hypothetical protein
MKRSNIFITGMAAVAIAVMPSCSKKIDEVYLNPNAKTVQPIETLLPNVLANMAISNTAQGTLYGPQNDGQYIGRYVQFWATNTTGNQYDQMGGATGASDVLGSIWAMHYYGMGQNLNRIIEWGTEQKKWDYVGVGYAIRAWSWLTLTDMYGDAVILNDAFNTSRIVFDYSSQQDVYEEVKKNYRLAMENLNKTGDGVSPANLALGDKYFYNGDVNKWKKFANSVMARVFHRTTNKASYQPDSVLYYGSRGIIDNADNAYVRFEDLGSPTRSYYGPFRGNIGAQHQTKFIADLESGLNPQFLAAPDPRAWYILRENTNGTFKGIRPNKGTDALVVADRPPNFWGNAFGTTTGTNTNARYVYKDAMPWPVITSAEQHLMMAEALHRANRKSEALTEYTLGISQDFDMLTSVYNASVPAANLITPATKAAYLANPAVVPTAAALTLSHIMMQKFIASFGYGFIETWVDIRRYHYIDKDPQTNQQVYRDFAPPSGSDLFAQNNTNFVYRARPRYNSEYLYNVDALVQVGAALPGGAQVLDYHTKEMWFSMP